jgi:REP element-mobilizing transposase RayT
MGQVSTCPYNSISKPMHQKRKRNRLKEYDYSNVGYYFVTICVNDRKDYFGKIENARCVLNGFGECVKNILERISVLYPYIEIDYYVIMPYHIHIIIIIDPSNVVTGRDLSLQNKPKQKIKSLSEIIGAFKTMSSKELHKKGLTEFKWQRSFYDRIIRNERELYQIRKYIEQNPLSLEIEKQLPENLIL